MNSETDDEGHRPRRDVAEFIELPPPEPADRARTLAAQQEAAELEQLMARVAGGDVGAFTELYDRTSARVYGLMIRVLRAAEPAAEVTEEVFADVWQQARRYHPDRGSVFAWIVTLAHRRAVQRVRASSGSSGVDDELAGANLSREIDEVWGVIEHALGTPRARSGIRAMTHVERQSLLLAYFESLDQTGVAEHLDVGVDEVRAGMREGLNTLRRALAGGER